MDEQEPKSGTSTRGASSAEERGTAPRDGAGTRAAVSRRHMLSVMRWPLGGIRTYLLYTHPALVQDGWRITFVGPAGEHFDSFADEVSAWPGVDCVSAPRGRDATSLVSTTRDQLRTRAFSLVVSQGLGAAAQVELARPWRPRLRRIPHVVTSHDVFPPGQHRGFKAWAKKRVLERLLARASVIVNVTDDARENLLEHLPLLRRKGVELVTIHHGIRPLTAGGATEAEAPLRGSLDLPTDAFLMGFLGRFMEQKGFLPLLDALEDLRARGTARPWHLVAIGSGDYVREYRREVEERRLADAVSFLPFMPDVMPVLRQLDLVVMPSLWEAAGLLAMEALVAGVPLLASDCLGLREVVRDTPAVTAAAGDRSAWADALGAVIADPPVEATRRYQAEARRRYAVDGTARRLAALLDGQAGAEPPPST